MSLQSALRSAAQLGRPYYLLFSAGVLADLGGFTTGTALTLHVYHLTNQNAAYLGLMALASLLPMLLAAPIGGVWAERRDRRRVLIACNLVRIPLVLLMMTTRRVELLLALQTLVSVTTALFMPSRQSLIPVLVRPEQLPLANAFSGSVLSVVHTLGPTLGAVLYARGGGLGLAVSFEALLFLSSVGLLLGLRIPTAARSDERSDSYSLGADIVNGLRYVLGEPDLRQLFTILLVSGTAIGLLVPLLRPFTDQVLHLDDRGYAWLMTSFGIGGMLGPLVGYFVGRALGLGLTLTLCFVLEASLFIVWTQVHSPLLSSALLVVWGVEGFALVPAYMSYVHLYARPDYLGRTFALFDQSMYAPGILAAGVIALLGSKIAAQSILIWAGLGYLAMVALTYFTAGARLLRSRSGRERMHAETEPPPEPAPVPALPPAPGTKTAR
jgi:predicted MFS family arabinose efflux permease